MPSKEHIAARIIPVLAFLLPLLLYFKTLCPTVWVGDSGELALAAARLEICHPPGYPLITLLGRFWVILFSFLKPIVALNLLSAIAASSAGLMLYLVVSNLLSRAGLTGRLIGLGSALLLCGSITLWSVAVSFEVYAFAAACMLASLYCWLRYDSSAEQRFALLGAYSLGMALTFHLSTAALLPLAIIVLLRQRHRLRAVHLGSCVLLLVIPLTAYLYFPIRSRFDLVLDWYNPETVAGLKQLVFAETYRRYLAAPYYGDLLPYLQQIWRILAGQYSLLFLPLALAGAVVQFRRERALAIALATVLLANISLNFTYSIMDISSYFLPAIIVCLIWLAELVRFAGAHVRLSLAVSLLLPLLSVLVWAANHNECNLSNRKSAELYARDLLERVPEGGWLFCLSDNSIFPTLYLRYAEQQRQDIEAYAVISTLPKLRRDLGLAATGAYENFPSMLLQAAQGKRQLVLTREPMQPPREPGTLLPGLIPAGLVVYVDSSGATPPERTFLNWRDPPHLNDPKEALLYAQYYLVAAESAATADAARLRKQAVAMVTATESPVLLAALSDYLISIGDFPQARRVVDGAFNLPILRRPQKVELLRANGEVLLMTGQRDRAAGAFRRVLDLDPDNVQATFQLLAFDAQDALAVGDKYRAIEYFERMRNLSPDQMEIWFRLGSLYLETGDQNAAVRMLRHCIDKGYRKGAVERLLNAIDDAP